MNIFYEIRAFPEPWGSKPKVHILLLFPGDLEKGLTCQSIQAEDVGELSDDIMFAVPVDNSQEQLAVFSCFHETIQHAVDCHIW